VLGGESSGGILAYDLTSGVQKWKWTGYKVAEADAYAYPIPAGKGLFIKDKEAVSFWAVD
jgi:hypothetical protein